VMSDLLAGALDARGWPSVQLQLQPRTDPMEAQDDQHRRYR
jgi:hypothetical protein